MASIDRRPNGKYRARWREYPSGPQKTRTFDRKRDAERFLVDIQHRLQAGSYVDPAEGQITLRAYASQWVKRQPWRHATVMNANKALAHILPALGDRPLSSIRRSDVQAFVAGLGDLSAGYVRRIIWTTLAAILDDAVLDGLIVRNVAKGVKLPALESAEVVPPTVAQVGALYEVAVPWFRPAVVLGAGLGLRLAEASGLTADRVLWLERAVRVDRQWLSRQPIPGFAPVKSTSSNRTVPASTWVLGELGRYVTSRDGFVLHREGQPVSHNTFHHEWRKTRARAGLDNLRFHDLRHAFASMLISAGCSVKAVSAALGHSSAAITLGVYSHLWPGDEDRIREAVDAALTRRAEDSLRTETAGG